MSAPQNPTSQATPETEHQHEEPTTTPAPSLPPGHEEAIVRQLRELLKDQYPPAELPGVIRKKLEAIKQSLAVSRRPSTPQPEPRPATGFCWFDRKGNRQAATPPPTMQVDDLCMIVIRRAELVNKPVLLGRPGHWDEVPRPYLQTLEVVAETNVAPAPIAKAEAKVLMTELPDEHGALVIEVFCCNGEKPELFQRHTSMSPAVSALSRRLIPGIGAQGMRFDEEALAQVRRLEPEVCESPQEF